MPILISNGKDIDEYIEKLEYAKMIKEEIMKIFELEEHKRGHRE